MSVELYLGDCLEILPTLEDASVDAVITDIPYGTTACSWDEVIPFDEMWEQVKRVTDLFVTTASQPFTSKLVMSNLDWFKYEWIWNKKLAGNGILAKTQPLKIHEDVCVFSHNGSGYQPQMKKGKPRWKGGIKNKLGTYENCESKKIWNDEYYPVSIIEFSNAGLRNDKVHLTQKPIALYEYLIKTYTNEGDTVCDIAMGSGTTGVACVQTGRNFIGIEIDPKYYDIAEKRIEEAQLQMRMPI